MAGDHNITFLRYYILNSFQGVYFWRLKAGSYKQIKDFLTMLFLKMLKQDDGCGSQFLFFALLFTQ
jgi:hypothetical protein